MARYAVIEDGRVSNVAEAEEEFALEQGWVQSDAAGIGWLWDGEEFSAPPALPVPVPASVTRRQARQALLLAGLLDDVQPAIDAIPDQVQRSMAQIEWDDSQEFQRERPMLIMLAAAIGLDSAQLDQLFITAAGL